MSKRPQPPRPFQPTLNRRGFLRGLSGAAAAHALSGCGGSGDDFVFTNGSGGVGGGGAAIGQTVQGTVNLQELGGGPLVITTAHQVGAAVGGSGEFTTTVANVNPQVVLALSAQAGSALSPGQIRGLALHLAQDLRVDAQSTAETIVFFAMGVLTPDMQTARRRIEVMRQQDSFRSLVDLVRSALRTGTLATVLADPRLPALRDAVANAVVDSERIRARQLSPDEFRAQGGVSAEKKTDDVPEGSKAVNFENYGYRFVSIAREELDLGGNQTRPPVLANLPGAARFPVGGSVPGNRAVLGGANGLSYGTFFTGQVGDPGGADDTFVPHPNTTRVRYWVRGLIAGGGLGVNVPENVRNLEYGPMELINTIFFYYVLPLLDVCTGGTAGIALNKLRQTGEALARPEQLEGLVKLIRTFATDEGVKDAGWAAEAQQLFRSTGSTWERARDTQPPLGVALAERFDQVLAWTQRIAGARSTPEVIEMARRAAEALLRCRATRLPIQSGEVEVQRIKPRESDTLSALLIPLPQGIEIYCASPEFAQLFGPEELRLAKLIQGQASVALDNARLWTELREREAHLQQLFSSVPAGVAVIDRQANVLQSNLRMSEMLGRSPQGRALVELLRSDDREWLEEALREADGTRQSHPELQLGLPDGRLLWGELSLQGLPGGDGRTILALADVSQRRLEQIAAFQEREGHLLASEVHDVLSQPLVALHLQLEALAIKNPTIATELRESAGAARLVLDDARSLIARLRSPQVESLRLSLALAEAVEELVDRSRTLVELELCGEVDSLAPLPTLFAYRIVVEALTNCGRHAAATHIRSRLSLRENSLRGIIADDGLGFTPTTSATGHFGLKIVRERAELLGGRLRLRSAPGRGTTVRFELPVDRS